MRKKLLIGFFLILAFLPLAVKAMTLEGGEKVLSVNAMNDDYYTIGNTIQLKGGVNGDMVGAGETILIDSPVSQDLTLAGGQLSVTGEVGDDARLAGGKIKVDSIIKDDLIMAGGDLELGEHGFVGGDLLAMGGTIVLNGNVNGNVRVSGGDLVINGIITGDVLTADVDQVRFGPNGKVMGNLSYSSPESSKDVSEKTVLGKIKYTASAEAQTPAGSWGWLDKILDQFSIFSLLALLFSGLFFLWIFRPMMTGSATTALHQGLYNLGSGLVVVFATPILALIFLTTGIGVPLFLLLIAAWLVLIYTGKLVAVFMVGLWLTRTREKDPFLRLYAAFATGAIAYTALSMIPAVGWALKFVLVLFGAGALGLNIFGFLHSGGKKKV